MTRRVWQCLAVLSIAGSLSGCGRTPVYRGPGADGSHKRGTVESVEYLKSYSALWLRLQVMIARLPEPLPISHGIELYRVDYWTEHLGKPELASGLYALPRGVAPRATVEWLHGTNPTRSEAPSAPSADEGVLISAAFAGDGYLLLAPDYVGLGASQTYHPYLYAPTTADSAIDFLRAARTVSAGMSLKWQPRLYLTGFSEGGFSTAVVQRALEEAPEPHIDLQGAASISGAFDLANISVPYALQGGSTASSLYLAYLSSAYARVYQRPLASIFTERYAREVPLLFDGNHTVEQIQASLPHNPREMFRPEFLDGFTKRERSWFRDALEENQAFGWAPRVRMRLYYGDNDKDVSPRDSQTASQKMKARGGNVELVALGPYTHEESVVHAVPRIRQWFDELSR